jgi:archaellum component FlaC
MAMLTEAMMREAMNQMKDDLPPLGISFDVVKRQTIPFIDYPSDIFTATAQKNMTATEVEQANALRETVWAKAMKERREGNPDDQSLSRLAFDLRELQREFKRAADVVKRLADTVLDQDKRLKAQKEKIEELEERLDAHNPNYGRF